MILTITRKGKMHISRYKPTNGLYHTMCGKTIKKKSKANIIAINNIISNICHICKKNYKFERVQSDDFLNKFQLSSFEDLRICHQEEILGPKDKFNSIFRRYYPKLSYYKRLMKRLSIYE